MRVLHVPIPRPPLALFAPSLRASASPRAAHLQARDGGAEVFRFWARWAEGEVTLERKKEHAPNEIEFFASGVSYENVDWIVHELLENIHIPQGLQGFSGIRNSAKMLKCAVERFTRPHFLRLFLRLNRKRDLIRQEASWILLKVTWNRSFHGGTC